MFANYLIGLREGLEASLVVTILVAYLVKLGRRDRLAPVAYGVGLAVAVSIAFGALLTFTSTSILRGFEAQEIFGGTLSIVAVGFVTWMVFWMRRTARGMSAELSGRLDSAIAVGGVAVVVTAFIAVAREGLETALFFWSAVQAAGTTTTPVIGFALGIATSIVLAWLLYRRSVSLNLARFFTWTGAGLIVVAAGVLAYGVHDLQEGGAIGGLFTLAFDVTDQVPSSSWYGALLKGTINFTAQTTVAQAIVWSAYIIIVMGLFAGPGVVARLRRAKGAGIAAGALLVVLLAAGCGGSGASKATDAAFTVKAGEKSCETTATTVPTGLRTFSVANTGSQVTEVYVYGPGDRIVGEVENIGPATSRDLIVDVAPGRYEIACKPGMTGSGIRRPLNVTGRDGPAPATSAQLTAAVAGYRRFVATEARTLVATTAPFVDAVKANDIPLVKRRYAAARIHYERIEPIAESFGTLDASIDARAGDVPATEAWTGFHHLERDLWQRRDIHADGPLADRLLADTRRLAATITTTQIKPDQLANGATSLLDEVSRTKVTGEEERYSHIDLVDFQGNLDGAKTAYAELRPVVLARRPALAQTLDTRFAALDRRLARHAHGSGFVSYTSLSRDDVRGLSTRVDAVAEPLSQVSAVVLR
jgi:high-affinity iron transporter